MKILFALILAAFFANINAQQPTFSWGYGFSGTGSDKLVDYAFDSHGNIIGVGTFQKTLYLNPKSNNSDTISSYINKISKDIFIVKYSPNGNLISKSSIGGNKNDKIKSIKVDANDNVYLLGEFIDSMDVDLSTNTNYLKADDGNINLFLAKYDKEFTLQWAFNISSSHISSANNLTAKCLELDKAGNIYISGTFMEMVDFNPNISKINFLKSVRLVDIFIAKYTTDGKYVWAQQFGNLSSSTILEPLIKIDKESNSLYLSATFSGVIDLNPSTAIDTISSNAKAGTKYSDFFIAKFDTACNYISARTYGGASSEYVKDMDVDELGNVYIAGKFLGVADFNPGTNKDTLVSATSLVSTFLAPTVDAFFAKYTSNGTFCWAKKIGKEGNDYATSIDVINNGIIYLAGSFADDSVDFDVSNALNDIYMISSTPDLSGTNLNNDFFISSYTTSGDFLWAGNIGGYLQETDIIIKEGRNNSFYIAGEILSSPKIDLNISVTDSSIFTKSNISGSGEDFFIAKYSNCYVNTNVSDYQSYFVAEESRVGVKYQWFDFATKLPITGANSKTFTPTTNGNYFCEISYKGCKDNSDVMQLKNVALHELSSNSTVSIFPNPAKSLINLTIQTTNLSELPNTFDILDLLGKQVMKVYIEKSSSNINQLVDVSMLNSGLYFIKFNNTVGKFIVE